MGNEKKFDLVENPLHKVSKIAGVSRIPENILAVRRIQDLRELIESLKGAPYWQAWVAFACLAGARFREQCFTKLDDVFLDDDGDYIRITSRASGRHVVGTKTSRERRIPIEKTILLPILKAHIARRKVEQRVPKAGDGERSVWLFPSIVGEGTIAREKSAPGLWSDNTVFLASWRKIAAIADAIEEKDADGKITLRWLADYWTYGPAEWRHTFGTALGNCGWSALEISRVMGNSPDVCERHYVGSTSQGSAKRWPLQ